MLRFDNCPSCFSPLNGREACPSCGYIYANDRKQPKGVIEPFSVLNDRYMVGKVLGRGGFGITYIAKDIINNSFCAIKEYMPTEYAKRDSGSDSIFPLTDKKSKYVFSHGREKFVEEAKTLYHLKNNPIVVDITDYFTQNNTAYLVMEYLDGSDLRKYARNHGGRMEPNFAKQIFVTVASALMAIHDMNILHRDLSPENIFLTNDGAVKLIDFGAARNYVSSQNKGLSILLKPGFAPPEQYSADGEQGPWSDVYGLCATFYNIVSGKMVTDAIMRYRGEKLSTLAEMGIHVSARTSQVIDKGLRLDCKQRYKDFGSLLSELDIEAAPEKKKDKRFTPPEYSGSKSSDGGSSGGFSSGGGPSGSASTGGGPSGSASTGGGSSGRVPSSGGSSGVIPSGYGRSGGIPSGYLGNGEIPSRFGKPDPITSGSDKTVKTAEGKSGSEITAKKEPVPEKVSGAFLTVFLGDRQVKQIKLPPDRDFKIGRSEMSDYVISGDSNISRTHCTVRYSTADQRFVVKDQSANGSYFEDGYRMQKGVDYAVRSGYGFYLVSNQYRFILTKK